MHTPALPPRRLAGLAAAMICAVALIPVAALAATASPASTSYATAAQHPAAAVPACGNAHPSLPGGAFVWASSLGNGFAGGVSYVVEISNVGRHACSLRGAPGAAVLGTNGHLIGSELPPSGKGPLITLKPGATAYFALTVHDAGAVCAHPGRGTVIIYLPGQRLAQESNLPATACPGLRGGGVLSPGTIKPGTGIPLYSV